MKILTHCAWYAAVAFVAGVLLVHGHPVWSCVVAMSGTLGPMTNCT